MEASGIISVTGRLNLNLEYLLCVIFLVLMHEISKQTKQINFQIL